MRHIKSHLLPVKLWNITFLDLPDVKWPLRDPRQVSLEPVTGQFHWSNGNMRCNASNHILFLWNCEIWPSLVCHMSYVIWSLQDPGQVPPEPVPGQFRWSNGNMRCDISNHIYVLWNCEIWSSFVFRRSYGHFSIKDMFLRNRFQATSIAVTETYDATHQITSISCEIVKYDLSWSAGGHMATPGFRQID